MSEPQESPGLDIDAIRNLIAREEVSRLLKDQVEMDRIKFRVNSALLLPSITLFAIAIPLISSRADTLYSPTLFLCATLSNALNILLCSFLVYSPVIRQSRGIHNRKSRIDRYAHSKPGRDPQNTADLHTLGRNGGIVFSKTGRPAKEKKLSDYSVLQVASYLMFVSTIVFYSLFAAFS